MEKRIQRVYFVGAGFSAGYPVGASLIRRLTEHLKRHRKPTTIDRAKALRRGIEAVLGEYFASDLEHIAEIDVAEFYTIAETMGNARWLRLDRSDQEPPASPGRTKETPDLFQQLAAATRSYFYKIGEKKYAPADVRSFIRHLPHQSDVIVDFNWDEEIELHLFALRKNVAYNFSEWRDKEQVLILKPHGSIGWYDIAQGIGNKRIYFIAEQDDAPTERLSA